MQRQRELFGALDDALDHLVAEVPRRIDGDGVARVDARPLDVLHDAGDEDVPAVADRVDLELFAHKVLVDEDGVLDLLRQDDVHIFDDVGVSVTHGHILTAEDVRGTQQRRITYLVCDLERLFLGHDREALGALDLQLFEQFVKPFAVLRGVDVLRLSAEDAYLLAAKHLGQLDRRLSAECDDDAVRLLGVEYAEHVLVRQRLEVQPVGGVEIGGDGLGVVVDDDHLEPLAFERPDAVDGRIVELDALSYADGTGAEDDDLLLVGRMLFEELLRLVLVVVGGIEVRRLRLEFRRAGVDHLVGGIALVRDLLAAYLLDGLVKIAHLLCLEVELVGERLRLETALHLDQLVQLAQEPSVDLGDVVDLVDRDAALERLEDDEDAFVVDVVQLLGKLSVAVGGELVAVESVVRDLRASDRLHDRLFERRADRHDLARRLHLSTQLAAGVEELVERPLGELDDDIVDGRLKACVGVARDRVLDLVEGVAYRDLGRDLRDRIAGRLGRERGRTRHAGVDLDDRILEAVRFERELAIAAALDFESLDYVERRGAQHLILFVRKGDRRGDDDAVAGMNADGVEVLHAADGDDVALAVAHHLELDLFPAADALLDQDLVDRGAAQTVLGDLEEVFLGVGDASAGAAERERRTYDDGIPYLPRDLDRGIEIVDDL